MGFEQNIVISSAVPAGDRRAILSAAVTRWPAVTGPFEPDSYPDRVVFAPPEMTSYRFAGGADATEGRRQNDDVRDGLPEWSRAFPAVTFAWVEAECFGGQCGYSGFSCRDGQSSPTSGGLHTPLAAVGVELETGYFEPFVRGFFAALRDDQWAGCTRPELQFLTLRQLGREVSERKQRLLSAAYLHRVKGRLRDPLSLRAVDLCERVADDGGDSAEFEALRSELSGRRASEERWRTIELSVVRSALWFRDGCSPLAEYGQEGSELAAQAALVRDLWADPFRPVAWEPSWLTPTVVALARGIDADRAFDRLPVLADALEEAGCDAHEVLTHCRGEGPHARGCWVVDSVLGR